MLNKELIDTIHWRRTKVIATLGPSSNSNKLINKLILCGVNVFRLNMSHGSHESHFNVVKNIRNEARKLDVTVAVLVDLCGPKIRVGEMKHGQVMLKDGQEVTLVCKKIMGDNRVISSQYVNLYKDIKAGDRVYIDDGKIELIAKDICNKEVICQVKNGGLVHDNKGMNLPDTEITASNYTRKDKEDTEFAIKIDADFIALSFVKDEKDIKRVKRVLKEKNADIPLIAKIERKEAIENIEGIVKEAYGIMIARGDLGIELPAQKVPILQRDLINIARRNSRPVIVATQMLESMIFSPRATRAEVSDVANAVMSGVDAVMLSAETASGEYPVRSVEVMDSILKEIEFYQLKNDCFKDERQSLNMMRIKTEREAFSYAVSTLAQNLDLKAIIVPTRSGTTAVALASDRPLSPLVAVCADMKICRRLLMHWGIITFNLESKITRNWKVLSRDISKRCLMTKKGNNILLVSGFNDDPELNEPVIKLVTL